MAVGELRVIEGPDAGRVVVVSTRTVLGRDKSADVVLPDRDVSRRHLAVSGDGGVATVEDLGSTNGTFVNDERISAPRTLEPGDRVLIGDTLFEFVPGTVPSPARKPPLVGAETSPPGRVGSAADGEATPAARRPSAFVGELKIVGGPGAGATARVYGVTTLGRDPDCSLVLHDEEISRRHAEVAPDGEDAVITDLRSTNGTYVNGERLSDARRLQHGDRVEIGSETIEYSGAARAQTKVRERPVPRQFTAMRQVIAEPNAYLTTKGGSRKWWTLLVVCGAVFMLLVDTTIVAVALPSISQSLNASFAELQWVIDAYALVLAALLLTSGALSDVLGRRHLFALGLTLFTVFSAVCGIAGSAVVLDVARGAQAVGGAMMFATSLALIAQEFPPAERGTAFGVWGATTATAVAIGPLVGGALTDAFGWESIFFVNVPIGLAALYLTFTKLANISGPQASVDVPGMVTFTVAIFALVFAVIRGNDLGWSSPLVVGLFVAAAVSASVFLLIETRQHAPMLDLSLFRKPTLVGASIVGFAVSASMLSLIIYIVSWFQSILRYSPLEAGLRMLAFTTLALFLSPAVGRFGSRVPARLLLGLGMAVISGAILLMTGIDGDSRWTVLVPGLVLAGVGMALTTTSLASTAVGVVPPWQAGTASGISSTFRQLGLALGVVVLGAFFQNRVSTNVERALAGTPAAVRSTEYARVIAAGGTPQVVAKVPPKARAELQGVAADGFAAGLKEIFFIAAILALIGAVAGALLVRRTDLWKPPAGGPPPGAR